MAGSIDQTFISMPKNNQKELVGEFSIWKKSNRVVQKLASLFSKQDDVPQTFTNSPSTPSLQMPGSTDQTFIRITPKPSKGISG